MFARLTPPLLFVAFILLLLVTLSAPIIDAIYLFRLALQVNRSAANAAGEVQFGVFGYCITRAEVSFFGFEKQQADRCSSTRLGYTIDDAVARVLRAEDIQDAITRTSTAAFVLNPIATGLTFFALVFSLFMIRREHFTTMGRHSSTTIKTTRTSRLASLATTILSSLAALVTTVTFIINIVIVAVVRSRIRDRTGDALSFDWGNAVWMTLGAMVALWIAVIGAIWGVCCGGRRSRKQSAY